MAKTAIMIANGCEEIEALTAVDLLRRAGIGIDMVSITAQKNVKGSHGICFETDLTIEEFDPDAYDGVILPGGMPGTKNLGESAKVTETVRSFREQGKLTAAICAAPTVFGACGILEGRKAACYPGLEDKLTGADVKYDDVVKDGSVITSRGMGTAIPFALALIAYFLGEDEAEAMAQKIVFSK
ncbi:MAG: DJ-1/PfpI family protein [Lachnospiraceae bacterium]|nr:DJ-1/PfpI family protein [Lachnospiraceae bacterium]